jgi:hypothetical protein
MTTLKARLLASTSRRVYAAYQTSKGWRIPVIVEKLDDIFERLGVTLSDFRRRER